MIEFFKLRVVLVGSIIWGLIIWQLLVTIVARRAIIEVNVDSRSISLQRHLAWGFDWVQALNNRLMALMGRIFC